MTPLLRHLKEPFPLAVVVFLGAMLITWPFGNYALNDDWTYAHVAKRFGETGVLKIDTPVVANTVGQSIIAAPVIRIFGFSFVALRALTFAIAVLGLYFLDRLLRLVTPSRGVRLAALLLLALNPIYAYSALTFMTEIYSWVPGLGATALWFWDRQRRAAKGQLLVAPWVALASGVIAASAFWIRQPGVIIYLAVVGGSVLPLLVGRRLREVVRSLPAIGLGMAGFVGVIVAFFLWAKASGNFPSEFQKRIPNLFHVDGTTWLKQTSAAIVYMTLYFLPWLVVLAARSRPRVLTVVLGAAVFAFVLWGRSVFEATAGSDYGQGMNWNHKSFPYLMNIVYNAGIGPITLSDVFWSGVPWPTWPAPAMKSIEIVLLAATPLWGVAAVEVLRAFRAHRETVTGELLSFGVLLVLGGMVAVVQAHQNEVVERYQFPILLALAALLPMTFAVRQVRPSAPVRRGRSVAFGLAFVPLAAFTIGGLHDMFAWNDSRWELIAEAYAKGATLATLEAGFESTCWNREEGLVADKKGCEGSCRCVYMAACCLDDTWRVGVVAMGGYTPISTRKPKLWLLDGPTLVLSKR